MLVGMFFLIFAVIAIASSIFWIAMLVDCATKEPSSGNDKLVWILIIVFTHWIGALLYYLVRRPQRKAQWGV
jgi:hypothetical protein